MIETQKLANAATLRASVVLAAMAVASHAVRMSEPYYHLKDEVVTPHVEWAKPYVKGTVKLLAIAPRWTQRETVELSERMDADITPVMTYGWEKLGLDPSNPGWVAMEGAFLPDVEAELTRALQQDYDCIVLGAFAWKLLPRKTQYLILKQVHDGAGLVYFYPRVEADDTLAKALAKKTVTDDAAFITTAVPFETLSAFAPDPEAKQPPLSKDTFLALHEFKGGRIALVRYPGRPDNLYCTPRQRTVGPEMFAEYEYYQSLAIRAILWAARKESGFALRMTPPPQVLITPAPVLSFFVDNGTRKAAKLEFNATVRDLWHQEEAERTIPLAVKPGSNPVSFPASPLKLGKHYLDVIATLGGKVVAWGSMVFETDGPTRLTDVVMPRDSWEKDETLTASVAVSGVGKPMVLVALLRDTFGREWARQVLTVQPNASDVAVRLPLNRALTIGHYLVAQLIDGRQVVTERSREFYVQQRDQSDFYLLHWPAGSVEYVGRMAVREAARWGTDLVSNCPTDEKSVRAIALENLRAMPYMTRYAGEAVGDKLITAPCFTAPEFLAAERNKLGETTQKLMRYSLAGYTLGDECFFLTKNVDACMSESCNADFIKYLKTEYPSLEALNEEWGTELKDWAEATPITLEEAKKTGQFARWADHRMHMETTFANVMRNADRAIREKDPKARVGFDGPFTTTSYAGYDWWKLSREFTMLGLYWHQPEQTEIMRSFLPPRTSPTGYWYGGYYGWRREGHERYVPWHTLLHGFNTAWWFAMFTNGAPSDEEDAISPDLRPYPEFLWTVDECNAIKRGIGKLLLQAQRQQDGIAILYSQASVHAATIYPTFGMVNAAQNGADWLIEDAGLQYDYLSYEQLANGELTKRGYKVCVLPNCQAISAGEAEALRRFVSSGGLVLADVGAGRMDGHCKQAEKGMLDDVFGIKFAPGDPKVGRGSLQPARGEQPIAVPSVTVEAEATVQVTDGEALATVAGVPAVILKRTGKGAAVLLNFAFAPYGGTRATASSDPYVSLLRSVFQLVGVKPRITSTAEGERLRAFEAVFYKDGGNEYLAVLPVEGGKPEGWQTTLMLDKGLHVYDMREGKDLGVTDTIKTQIVPARAKVFSLLPYSVDGVKASAKLDLATRLASVEALVQTTGAAPGTHCFHVEVEGPDGKRLPWYAQNVLGLRGRATLTVPFAFNDTAGKWRIRILDAASGKATTVTVVLR